jgi:DNA-binding LytR/AlgR family response regulator
MEEQLPADQFFRIHKSFIINMKKIVAIEGNMVEISARKLTIGNNYRADFFDRIGKQTL